MRRGRRPYWLPGLIVVAALCLSASNNVADLRGAITFAADIVSPTAPGADQQIVTGDAATGIARLMPLNVGDKSNAVPTATARYQWWSRREDQRIKLRGMVPSEEDRKTIHGMIKANMPDLEIDDRMEVAKGGPSKQMWLGAVSFALLQLGQLTKGTAWLRGTDLSIEGQARTAAALAAVEAAMTMRMPIGIAVKRASITPPIAKPFLWTAAYEGASLILAGNVPNDELRAELLQQAGELFRNIKIMDRMELAAGAPRGWAEAVAATLQQLARLESGKVSLADTALAIEGVAATKEEADDITAIIKQGLPKGYNAKDSIRHRLSAPNHWPSTSPGRSPEKTFEQPRSRSVSPA